MHQFEPKKQQQSHKIHYFELTKMRRVVEKKTFPWRAESYGFASFFSDIGLCSVQQNDNKCSAINFGCEKAAEKKNLLGCWYHEI